MFMKNSDSLRFTPTGLYGGTQEYGNDQQSADYLAQVRAAVANPVLPPTGSAPPHDAGPPIVPLAAAGAFAAFGVAANAAFALRRRN
jgi:hypothetical protein